MLTKDGHYVVLAADGVEAVAAVKASHFEVLLMDMQMPVRIPIVAMTADARKEDEQRRLAARVDDYVSKPTSLEELQAMVDHWIPTYRR
jgi:two-component system, sensor histidine kinase and response regulator